MAKREALNAYRYVVIFICWNLLSDCPKRYVALSSDALSAAPKLNALLTVRFVLRCILSLLLLAPAVANTVLVLVWRSASSVALDTPLRCIDVDVVRALRMHAM